MNKYLIAILIFCISISTFGQQFTKQEKIERLKAQKVAFITNKLNLTSEEAQQFWPIYNEFFKKKELIAKEKKIVNIELQTNWSSYSEEKKTELADKLINFQLREAKLEQTYHNKYKEVLSIDKVIMLYNAESQYKNFLLKQIKGQANINPSTRNFKRK